MGGFETIYGDRCRDPVPLGFVRLDAQFLAGYDATLVDTGHKLAIPSPAAMAITWRI